MFKTKQIFFTILFLLFFSLSSKSQQIEKSVGIRTGEYSGIVGRLVYNKNVGLEGVVGWRNGGTVLSVKLSKIKPLDFYWSEGFSWYYGFGTHFGYANTGKVNNFGYINSWDYNYQRNVFVAGIDGIIGIEYDFRTIPFSIGFETQPYVELFDVRYINMELIDFSFTIRYKIDNK